jgi:hypothetical protein
LAERYNIVELAPASEKGSAIVKGDNPRMVEQYKVLKSRHDNALLDLNTISTLYDQHEASSKETVSTVYVVEKAFPADRKAWPIRWLIVVSSALIALFLGVVGALLIDQMSAIKQQLNAQPENR